MKKIFLFLTIVYFINNQYIVGQTASQTWNYPIRPGTSVWNNLSYKDQLNAYNIPEELLKNMNTSNLLQACFDYPEFRLIMTRSSFQQGFDYLKTIFNGFVELEKRNDAGQELLNVYKKLSYADVKNFGTPLERGEFSFKMKYLEIILAQNSVLVNLNQESKEELIRLALSNLETVQKMPEQYSTFGLITPSLLLVRILNLSNYEKFLTMKAQNNALTNFLDYSVGLNTQITSEIHSISMAYLDLISK